MTMDCHVSLNPSSLAQQQVLLTGEPSLQPLSSEFVYAQIIIMMNSAVLNCSIKLCTALNIPLWFCLFGVLVFLRQDVTL